MIIQKTRYTQKELEEELARLSSIQQTYPVRSKHTFYFTDKERDMLDTIFVKRIKNKSKSNKSSIIAEALKLLYKKEMDL